VSDSGIDSFICSAHASPQPKFISHLESLLTPFYGLYVVQRCKYPIFRELGGHLQPLFSNHLFASALYYIIVAQGLLSISSNSNCGKAPYPSLTCVHVQMAL
jgi:hypothetical protein